MQNWLRHHAIPLIVRHDCIRSALLWLKAHNVLYHNVLIDEHSLNSFPMNNVLPVHIELVNEIDAGEVLTSHYDVPQLEVCSPDIMPSDNETIFNSIVVAGLGDNATINQMWAAAMVGTYENKRRWLFADSSW